MTPTYISDRKTLPRRQATHGSSVRERSAVARRRPIQPRGAAPERRFATVRDGVVSIIRPVKEWVDLYPTTQPYIIGAVVVASLGGWIGIRTALILLASTALLAVLIAERAEVTQIHHKIDGQRVELVNRIDDLTALLCEQGVKPPPEATEVQQARVEKEVS
jgi:hypothetical protein